MARAVVGAAGPDLPPVSDFTSLPGLGARGTVEGRQVTVGRADVFDTVPDAVRRVVAEAGDGTPVVVGCDGVAQGVLVVADAVKPTSADAVRRLQGLGLRTVLLTGDHEAAAQRVAGEVGIDTVIAGVRPEGKVDAVRTCRTRAGSWRWRATASTTRPPSPRPTSAWRWAPAPTWRSRPAT